MVPSLEQFLLQHHQRRPVHGCTVKDICEGHLAIAQDDGNILGLVTHELGSNWAPLRVVCLSELLLQSCFCTFCVVEANDGPTDCILGRCEQSELDIFGDRKKRKTWALV